MEMNKEYLNGLSERVIGAAIEVHRELGSGLLESTYEAALHHELGLQEISSVRQLMLPVRYKGLEVDEAYRIDLLVEEALVVELKTVDAFRPVHSAQLLTYLRMADLRLGLLINFHSLRLIDGIKRQVHNFPTS